MSIEPLRKPSRFDRKKKPADTSDLPLSKEHFDRDERFRAFVRGHVCCVVSDECGGVTEHAHIGTGGKGVKAADYYSVPLCTRHHYESHNVGIYTFQLNHQIDLWEVCAQMLAAWIRRNRKESMSR